MSLSYVIMCESVFVFTVLSDLNYRFRPLPIYFLFRFYRFRMSDYSDSNFSVSVSDRSNKYENGNDLSVFSTVSDRFHL
jgi:hypothetical protein